MKLPRRKFLHLAAGATALPATSRIGWAQAYPSRPVRIVVAAAAGGPTDIVARLISQWFSDRIGQRLITQPRNQPRSCRSKNTGEAIRFGLYRARWLSRGLRQAHRRGNREVGQGDPGGKHQTRMTRPGSPFSVP